MSTSEIFPGIVSDSEILGGDAVIKDTRIPVSLILTHLASDMSIEEILDEYDLTVVNIHTVFVYAAKQVESNRQ